MTEPGTPAIDPALEAAYNCRAAVPDHPAIFARWAEHSAAVRTEAGESLRRDLRYGDGSRRTLDLFGGALGMLPRPLLIFLHGGYWQSMDKSSFSFLAPRLIEAGAAVAVVNYPLCPEASLPVIVAAVREAVQMLWHEATPLGLDRRRFIVAGHSAGGHLVAELMCTRWPDVDAAMPVDAVKGGVALSGLFDLRPLVRTSINEKLGLDGPAAERNSPLFRDPVPGGSLTLAVGELEHEAFHGQAARLAQRWAALGVNETWLTLPGRHHFSVVDALADPYAELFHDTLGRLGLGQRRTTRDLTDSRAAPKV
ncbi:alpha/beta hydrolase [Roseospira goensis]|uniref:Arylformamidase n=1 Tax=Roseospira goensis TaxID=391922 RepID=A0A7W6RXT5_9PROT|nr:alpha/beta hydrolase [Roseospira goensis]MBB4285216.1 arylformamidase [Roseospira goensis]